MDPRRWQRIEELYHSALQRSPELREGFLAAECRDDAALYREVQDLLTRDEEPSAMLDRPARSCVLREETLALKAYSIAR